jgi:hypothetical protein
MRQPFITHRKSFFWLLFIVVFFNYSGLFAQSVTGQVEDFRNHEPIPYATISLYNNDSVLITGTITGSGGRFNFQKIPSGIYSLHISFIGYRTFSRKINLTKVTDYNAGILFLKPTSTRLGEVEVKGTQIKANALPDKTIYFVNKKMLQASNTGLDVLKYVPGIQIDFNQNIYLNGNRNVIILVDGKRRDAGFVKQLDPNQIEKVEIISVPGSKYDASVSGVINIRLKRKQTGISGYLHAGIPTSRSAVYISPGYTLNYGGKKFNLYTSYSGEIHNFPIVENFYREIFTPQNTTTITSQKNVFQKNWSHRFNLGLDYFLNKRNHINFYTYYNPYSNEYNGTVTLQSVINQTQNHYWKAQKKDYDRNHLLFGSLYFKHLFHKPGQELTLDAGYSYLNANNSTTYNYDNISNGGAMVQVNTLKPRQHTARIKLDFSAPLSKHFKMETGLKGIARSMTDQNSHSFQYRQNILAGYSSFSYSNKKFRLNTGLRVEQSITSFVGHFTRHVWSWLPSATVNYQLSKKENLRLSYQKIIYRPDIFELNPYVSHNDPFSIQSGNPNLKPQYSQNLFIDYSFRFNSNFLSARLFYKTSTDLINSLTSVHDSAQFETSTYNTGKVDEFGVQLSGALKLGSHFAFNPYMKVFNIFSFPNALAQQFQIGKKQQLTYDFGVSAISSFAKSWTAAFRLQYFHPRTYMQATYFSDALYFISLEKTLKKKLKLSIITALPFKKSFTYQGENIISTNFNTHMNRNIQLSLVPFWFTISYHFSSGRKLHSIKRQSVPVVPAHKKGF